MLVSIITKILRECLMDRSTEQEMTNASTAERVAALLPTESDPHVVSIHIDKVKESDKIEDRPNQRMLATERCELQAELRAVRSSFVKELKFLCILAVTLGLSILFEFLFNEEPNWRPLLASLIFPGAALVYILVRVIDAWRQVRFSRKTLRIFDRILSDIMS